MDAILAEIIKYLPAAIAGIIPAVITFISLNNRQRSAKIEAQEIVFEQFRKQADEIERAFKLLDDEKQARKNAQAEHENERDKLSKRLTDNSTQLKKVETALTQTEDLLKAVITERDGAKTELDATKLQLTNTRRDLEARLGDVQSTLDQLNKDYTEMGKLYSDLQDDRKRIEKAFQERVSKLETDLAAAENRARETNKELTAVQSRITDLEAQLAETVLERDGLQQQNAALQAEQEQLKRRVSELETERDGLQMQVNTLRTELDELRSSGQKPDNPTEPTDLPLTED